MNRLARNSLARLRAGLDPNALDLKLYITRETYIAGRPFSFRDHYYQEHLADLYQNTETFYINKPSQIGATEIFHRLILGEMDTIPGTSILLLMPTHKFSGEVAQTRISPIIRNSPKLRDSISKYVDSVSVKQFNNDSIIYFLGARKQSSGSTLINRPIKRVIADEYDRCDIDIVAGTTSRQTHFDFKPRQFFSTPTLPDIGIDAMKSGAQIHRLMLKCDHCGHWFWPDYLNHVRIEGYSGDLSALDKQAADKNSIDLTTATLYCPKCDRPPGIHDKENRAWDIENKEATEVFVNLNPFDSPRYVTPISIAVSRTKYTDVNEWRNQSLGIVSTSSGTSIDTTKLTKFSEIPTTGINVLGVDMGRTNWAIVATLHDYKLFVHHLEAIPLEDFETRITTLRSEFSIRAAVMDSLPYQDLALRVCSAYPEFWAALFYDKVSPEIYKLSAFEEEEATTSRANKPLIAKTTSINKPRMIEYLVGLMTHDTSPEILFKDGPMLPTLKAHMETQRRMSLKDAEEEGRFRWVTARSGQHKRADHLFMALIYVYMASRLIGASGTSMHAGIPIRSFRMKTDL